MPRAAPAPFNRPDGYVYFWNRPEGQSRKGQRCIVTARGKMNSIRVEFADGFKMITSRNSVRRPSPATEKEQCLPMW